ncbi:type II toxin-antitoxin system RelE/ParE family toxin [Flavobacterium sp.]|uniref:type II toxin-antitoxin system RelE/ParE family toxin n=1 Tax=Flavobacterium sp. TaxID=239 RepID=UPI00286CBF2B|nr:type II toxin-antitoxin system RelE/ParE family toxin [Flavobacterium sp.]
MTVKLIKVFQLDLIDQVRYIYKDKPIAALKFRKDLIKNLKKDLKSPYHFKKSIYYNSENIRDYVFKGYTSVYEINIEQKTVFVFGFIKHKDSL